MINNSIKYPIALNKKTKKIININNVTSNDKNELICYSCQNEFTAIINHQTPHFRHKPDSNCNSNVESYIHWLTKEVFKEIKTINLPKITISNLNENQRENVNYEIDNLLSKNNIPFGLRNRFKQKLKKNISNLLKVEIEKVEIEKTIKSNKGNVKVDIIATILNSEVLIEPYFTSKITIEKKEKLKSINKPTFSINLIPFITKHDYNYEIDDLKNYLINDSNKNWEIIRENKINDYIQNYLNYVKLEIKNLEPEILIYNENYIRAEKLELEIRELEEQIKPIREKIKDLNFELSIIESKIGKYDKTHKSI